MNALLADESRLIMFAQNICLLIFLLLGAAVLLIFLLSSWTGARVFFWQMNRKQAEIERRRERFSASGRELPPTSRGICESCSRVAEVVYHLRDGRRLCGRCFDPEAQPEAPPPAEPERTIAP